MSRCKVVYYKHNNLNHLEQCLQNIQQKDNQNTHFKLNRRFIVTEGVFLDSGKMSNLSRIISLKNHYKYRLIVDDSHGFGVLGKRGSIDYWNVPFKEVDIYAVAMDTV